MPRNTADKSKKLSVSMPETLAEYAESRAKMLHGGYISKYLQVLVEQDMGGAESSASVRHILDRIEDLQAQLDSVKQVAEPLAPYGIKGKDMAALRAKKEADRSNEKDEKQDRAGNQ